jgi:hypothetical protein
MQGSFLGQMVPNLLFDALQSMGSAIGGKSPDPEDNRSIHLPNVYFCLFWFKFSSKAVAVYHWHFLVNIAQIPALCIVKQPSKCV